MSEKFTGTRAVSPQHAFDTGRLADWLRAHVEGFSGDLAVEQFDNSGQVCLAAVRLPLPPAFAVAIGHAEKWKLHNNCK